MKSRKPTREFRNSSAQQTGRGTHERREPFVEMSHASTHQGQTESAHLYGVAPVLEALRAGTRTIDRITVAEGARHHRLRELIASARTVFSFLSVAQLV